MIESPTNEFKGARLLSDPPIPPVDTAAEEIRAHLCFLRGGGLFLSSADADRLFRWLGEGFSVVQILHSIEQAAEARRKRRSRLPLTLGRVQTYLKKNQILRPPTANGSLQHIVLLFETHGSLSCAERLRRISADDLDLRLRQAIEIARDFLEHQWNNPHLQQQLRTRAQQLLAALDLGYDEQELAQAVEEVARDELRRQWPMLDTAALWASLAGVR